MARKTKSEKQAMAKAAVDKVLTCDDLDIVATVADSAKVAGIEMTANAMFLRALDEMAEGLNF